MIQFSIVHDAMEGWKPLASSLPAAIISKLEKPMHCGDWKQDRPLRWQCVIGPEIQQFSTKKQAKLYARIRFQCDSQLEAMRKYAATR